METTASILHYRKVSFKNFNEINKVFNYYLLVSKYIVLKAIEKLISL